jgi:hypothetical protein
LAKHEYYEGTKAREAFEQKMTALFRVPKTTRKNPEKPVENKPEKGQG